MNRLVRRLIPCLLLLVLSMPASALLLSTGEQHVFNFDFTTVTPLPPFEVVTVETELGRRSAHGNTVIIDWFGGLDASGAALGGSGAFAVAPFSLTVVNEFRLADILDGVFSIQVTSLQGLIDVGSSARVCASGCGGVPNVGGTAVPEPGSLMLLAVAFGALLWLRRRPSKASPAAAESLDRSPRKG